MTHHFRTTAYLILLISMGFVLMDIYLPSLLAIANYFSVGDNEAQMTLFTYTISISLSPLIFGPLSDHIGRKKVILGGISTTLVGTIGCLFSPTITWIIFFRAVQGVGAGAVLISSRASVSDLFAGVALAKQVSLMSMLMPLVLALAPTLGGFLQEEFGWQSVFVFLFFYLLFILSVAALKSETLQKVSDAKVSQILLNYRTHLKNRPFIIYGVNFILPMFGMMAYLTTSPFLFQKMIGLSPAEYGSLALYVGATILFTGFINLKLLKYYSTTTLMTFGASIVTFAGCLLLTFHFMDILTTWSLLVPSLLYFTCMPLCIANAASQSMNAIKSNYGGATALLTTLQFLAGSFGSFIFTQIYDETALPLALCFTLVGVLALINLGCAKSLHRRGKLYEQNQSPREIQ